MFTQAGGAQRTPLKVLVEVSVLAEVFAEMGVNFGYCSIKRLIYHKLGIKGG